MNENEPQKLYRFRPIERFDEVICEYVNLSPPWKSNDPFDSSLRIKSILEKDQLEYVDGSEAKNQADLCNLLVEVLSELPPSRDVQEVRLNVRVACFSAQKHPKDMLMWSHYAKNHSGFCIEYDFVKLRETVKSQGAKLEKVRYVKKLPTVSDLDDVEDVSKAIFEKFTIWDYEEEWRIASFNQTIEKVYVKECIDEVIIGCMRSPLSPEVEKLRRFCHKNNIKISYRQPFKTKFELKEDQHVQRQILDWERKGEIDILLKTHEECELMENFRSVYEKLNDIHSRIREKDCFKTALSKMYEELYKNLRGNN